MMRPAALLSRILDLLPAARRQRLELVPSQSIASRDLVAVIAIMTFLAALTGGAAMLVRDAAAGWSSSVSREMTIQVKPAPSRALEKDVAAAEAVAKTTPGVRAVRTFTREQSASLLEPWLGAGVNASELPIPILIVLDVGDGAVDMNALRARLKTEAPGALLDDHRGWTDRLDVMARGLLAVAFVIVGLVFAAMSLAVAFATRGAMAGNKEIIDVLHFVGAADRFIAREFQIHFLRLGLKGGVLGSLFALLAFTSLGAASSRLSSRIGAEQVEALFGRFDLSWGGYAVMVAIAAAMALLTGVISRAVVYRHLRAR
ncbi:MAG TPA: ABC transporter permease [Beijerinckiaceae bacterium]|jgi:cell division transport system permease protein